MEARKEGLPGKISVIWIAMDVLELLWWSKYSHQVSSSTKKLVRNANSQAPSKTY